MHTCGGSEAVKYVDFSENDVKTKRPQQIADPINQKLHMLLVNPPPWLPTTPPLGPMCVGVYLQKHGFNVQLLDLNIELFWSFPDCAEHWLMENSVQWLDEHYFLNLFAHFGGYMRRRVLEIVAANPECIGISVVGGKQRFVMQFIELLVAAGCKSKIILGGPGLTVADERAMFKPLRSHIYAFVIGEGEAPCLEIMRNLDLGPGAPSLPGTVWGCDDNIRTEPKSVQIPMDDLPFYNPHLVDAKRYLLPGFALEWTRGCVKRCNFCEIEGMWGRFRTKSPEHRLAEVRSLIEETGGRQFYLTDPAINGARRVLLDFCSLAMDAGIQFLWSGHAIASRVFTRADYQILRAAGCHRLEFGVESGSEHVLTLMNKNTPVDLIERNLADSKGAGIHNAIFLMVGYPGETREDFEQTIAFVRRNRDSIDEVRSVNALYIQRNTTVWRKRETLGIDFESFGGMEGHLWSFDRSNTLVERQERVALLSNVIEECGILYGLRTGLDEFRIRT